MSLKTHRWNTDKKHRCPGCHAVHHWRTGRHPSWRWVYHCCHCHAWFARWPRLAWWLPTHLCESEDHAWNERDDGGAPGDRDD